MLAPYRTLCGMDANGSAGLCGSSIQQGELEAAREKNVYGALLVSEKAKVDCSILNSQYASSVRSFLFLQ